MGVSDQTISLQNSDKQHIWHPFTQHLQWSQSDPVVIVAGDGMHLIDSEGNRYLDSVSSLWCNVHGHRVPEIDQAIREQLDRVAHSTLLGLTHQPAIQLAEALIQIVPNNLTKVFFSDSGATAVEVAFKLAVQYWHNIGLAKKCEFVGFAAAYHGDTFGAMSVGRSELSHRAYFPLLFKTHFAPTPFVYHSDTPDEPLTVCKNALIALEDILKNSSEQIAAICIEPIVQGAGGMIVHPKGFLQGVRKLCSQYNCLMIADEVAVGFGRTGKMFACEHEDVEPDLLCAAKGITGGYLPLAATFATQKIFDSFVADPSEGKTFYHGHTYTANPLACAAALASLGLFEKNSVLSQVNDSEKVLAKLLEPLRNQPHVGDIRQKGMMVGIELIEDKKSRTSFDPHQRVGAQVCQNLRKHGILLRPLGDVIVVMPPLVMAEDYLTYIMQSLTTELYRL